MTTLKEEIETTLPIEETFAYIGDFATNQEWDPGTESATRLDTGPLGVGSRFALRVHVGSRIAPMEYRITDWDPPRRVVLVGEGSGVWSRDDIRFEATPTGGTTVHYMAEIKLTGLLRFVQPFLGGAFANVGRRAAAGMRRELAKRAERSGAQPGGLQ